MAQPVYRPAQPPASFPGSGYAPLATPRPLAGVEKRVLIPYAPVKLDDLNPLMRNTNVTTDAQEIKVGPSAWMKIGGIYHGWVEGIQNTGFPAGDGMTAFMKVTAPTLQGPYTFSPATTRILDAGDESTWEHYEFSPADVVLSGGKLVFMCHGGNNSGPQDMGVVRSTDTGAGVSGFTKDPGNPLMVVGATGAWDDRQVGNDFKLVRYRNNPGNPFTGTLWAAYRGRKAGSFTDGLVGRAIVSSDFTTFTKDPAASGQVIFSAPSFNAAGGITSGTPVLDDGGRVHMWAPGGASGIAKLISDDDGRTWSYENGGNAVLSPSGTAGAYDQFGTGDVVQTFWEVDVAFLLYGTENISTYPTNNPMRGQSGAVVPFPCVLPNRLGKFHHFGSAPRTTVDTIAANAIVSPLNLSIFSMCGRFRAYRTSRATPRRLYAEVDAVDTFNRTFSISIESSTGSALGSAGAGRLHVFHRTSGGIVELWSDAVVDDALWHTWLLRRIGLASWEFYVDGVKQTGTNGTSSTSVSLDSTAVNKCIGNMPTTSGTPNQPSNFTQSNVHLCNGYAMTAAESVPLIDTATPPPSGTLTINWPLTAYADSGNVVQVEAAAPQSVAITTAAETESALAPAISLGIGIAVGANTALAPAISLGIGIAATTNAALAQAISLGTGVAAGTNIALAPNLALGITPATETDQALRAAPSVGTALETDAAFAPAIALGIGASLGTNTALAQKLALGIAPANENDVALRGGVLIGLALETDSAFAPKRTLGILPANDNEIALAPGIRLSIVAALETNAAVVAPTRPAPPSRTRAVGRGGRAGLVARTRRAA